ncbi:hypothetical protein TW81_04070 [Vibrio galatheae]|uniref:Putative DNA-binding domain-containing protein n=1 Tax=Vibrio galatheae TaxID=579748 RepID=A0A0F4NNC7_9VIBR|nr:DNA-binding domain-containing protein [Vibrio galatheae]KJY84369.1 hypothetical protein TW81_04070 [Vibrio galatheae]
MTLDCAPSLAELQNTFARALHYQATGEDCDIHSGNFTADQRMQIYRNNFIIGLSEVLQASYPMLHALWGEECFAQVARQHVLSNPLENGDVSHYGQYFDKTIKRFPAVVEAAPYSLEVARYEWQIDLARQLSNQQDQASDLRPLDQLAHVSPQDQARIQLLFKPGVTTFQSCYALFSLQEAINTNNFDDLNLEQAEQGIVVSSAQSGVWTLALDEAPFQLIEHLQSGKTLGEIPPSLLGHLDWLTQHQLLAGFTLTELGE